MRKSETPIEKAVRIAGGQTELARKLTEHTNHHYKQGHVWGWLNGTRPVKPEVCIPIEEIVEGEVSRHDLRPDVFGQAETAN